MTGVCQKCGPTRLRFKYDKGKKFVRCGIAIKAKRAAETAKLYGASVEDIATLRKQKYCTICKKRKRLVIDHDHKTGKIRGVICPNCNLGLGFFCDSPQLLENAVVYLLIKRKTR